MNWPRRSRGTPRIANRLLRRARDFAQVKADGVITLKVVQDALKLLEIDEIGLDQMDRMILLTIIDKFNGGPVGLDTLAAAICEESDTIEDVYEPFLIQQGFLNRTPRGRMATRSAYLHFARTFPEGAAGKVVLTMQLVFDFPINPKFSFENFVVCSGNEYGLSVCQTVGRG